MEIINAYMDDNINLYSVKNMKLHYYDKYIITLSYHSYRDMTKTGY